MENRLGVCALVLGSACALAAPLASAEIVGRVLMTAGETSALRDGKVIPLRFGSSIEGSDTLQTGQRSNLQVRMSDESILSLREQTQLRIEEYKYAGKPDESESAIFRLVKGAFRTATGLIGRADKTRYAVRTPSATIGIRGTMYAAGVCDKDCFNADGSLAPDGLYGMVIGQSQGTSKLALTNKAGETVLRPGQVFFVANESTAPDLLLEPPAHLIDKLAGAGKADRPTAAAMGFPGKDKEAAEALSSLGDRTAGGISSDSQPNALPTSLGQVAAGAVLDGFTEPNSLPTSLVDPTPRFTVNAADRPSLPPGSSFPFQSSQSVNATGFQVGVLPTIQSQTFVNIGGTGIVRGQLLWTTTADMDLHMRTPDGQEVAFFNTIVNFPASSPTATATLDIDNTQGINHPTAVTIFQGQTHAVENIRVSGTTVPSGNYTFFTQNFSGVTTAPILLVTGDNNVTNRRFNVPALTSGATSQNFLVTRNPSGTATYSGPQ